MNLALDISRKNTGIAWGGETAPPRTASYAAPPGVGGDFSRTFAAYDRWLLDQLAIIRPTRVCFEAPIQIVRDPDAPPMKTSQETIEVLFGLVAITQKCVYQYSDGAVRSYKLHAGTGRKAFTGSGHSKKEDVMAQCRRLGWVPANYDESDALCVLWSMLVLDPKWSPPLALAGGRR
jgi:hypothetical protein